MKLTIFERRTLWLQYEILKHVSPEQEEHCLRAQEVLRDAYASLYEHVLGHFERDDFPQASADFVCQVLEMFDAIKRHYEDRKLEVPHEARFRGFDGNNESDLMGFARFNVEGLKRWTYLNISSFNSHMPVSGLYARMLEQWDQTSPDKWRLTEADVQRIVRR